jgi:hypothetical protein
MVAPTDALRDALLRAIEDFGKAIERDVRRTAPRDGRRASEQHR